MPGTEYLFWILEGFAPQAEFPVQELDRLGAFGIHDLQYRWIQMSLICEDLGISDCPRQLEGMWAVHRQGVILKDITYM